MMMALCAVAFVGCDKDDDNKDSFSRNDVIGTWKVDDSDNERTYHQYKADGSMLAVYVYENGDCGYEEGKWSLSGNVLSLTVDRITMSFTITTLTKEKMVLKATIGSSSLTRVPDSVVDNLLK